MTTTQSTETRTLLTLAGANHWFLERNLEGIGDAEALQPPGPRGNSLNWVMGHLAYWRRSMLEILDGPAVGPDDGWEIYDGRIEGARPWRAEEARTLSELASLFRESQEILESLLTGDDADHRLAQPCGDETVGVRMLKLLGHETYHVGQTGLLRRLLGHPGAV